MKEKTEKKILDFLIEPRTFREISGLFPNVPKFTLSSALHSLWVVKKIECYDSVYAVTPQVSFKEILARIKERDRKGEPAV